MYISVSQHEMILCQVSPCCTSYGKHGYPVFVLYDDDSFCRMEQGKMFYRSPAGTLKKRFFQFTIEELRNIIEERPGSLLR